MCDNERGTYEHPDHIAANRVTVAAFLAAGDATASMDGLPPWQPKKLYYTAISRSDFTHMAETLREHGIAWGEEEDANEFLQYTVPDEIITTRIDVTRYRPRVRLAMKEYRTQIAADDPWLSLPEDYSLLQGTDSFRRIRSLVDAPVPETDLFSGLR